PARRRADLTSATAVAAGAAWARGDSWTTAELSPVLDLAARTGVVTAIRDQSGQTVISSAKFGTSQGPRASAPVTVDGQQIGEVEVRSTGTGLGAADRALENALLRAIARAGGLAPLLALLHRLLVSRRITRPVTQPIAVTPA